MSPDPASPPLVSVIIPAYDSHATLGGCLAALQSQTFSGFEVLVIDSGPDPASARLAAERFPWVRFERSARRLLPHAARNRGVALARGELLVFTDPDIYAPPDWLERLVAAHRATDGPVVGALDCHGERWLDRGIHLCKFSKWLPAPPGTWGGARADARPVDMSPTANMLVARRHFEAVGGMPGDDFQGDVVLSRRLLAAGHTLWFEPRAAVAHHHIQDLRGLLRERYRRGREFGALRCTWLGGRRSAIAFYLLASLLPIRLPRILWLVALHAARAGWTGRLLATLPVVAAGHAATLAGESAAYLGRLSTLPHHRAEPAPPETREGLAELQR